MYKRICFPILLLSLSACPGPDQNPTGTETDTTNITDPVGHSTTSGLSTVGDRTTSTTSSPNPTSSSTSEDITVGVTMSTTGDTMGTTDDTTGDTMGTTTGDTMGTTTGDTMGTTTLVFDCHTVEEMLANPDALDAQCAKYPWMPPADCSTPDPTQNCQQIFEILGTCGGFTLCDYKFCRWALEDWTCGDPPPSDCEEIFACLNTNFAPATVPTTG